MLSRLFGHFARYSGASLMLTVASVISFPILTRLFTVEQYGLLSYVGLVLTMLVGVAKLGMQHAAVRFRSEVEGRGQDGINEYVATVVFGMALTGLAATVIWAGLGQWLPDALWNHPLMKPLLLLTCVLVGIRTIESAFVNLLKADEQSAALGIFMVTRRYIELAAILVTLFFISRSLTGFYLTTIVVELLGLVALITWYTRRNRLIPSAFSPTLFRTMLAYSIPMIGFELASIVLSLGDRYVIQSRLGAVDLGIYSAAYNLSDYIKIVLITSVGTAVMPIYLRLFEQQGGTATQEFLGRVLHFYLMVSIPVVAGLIVVGEPVVALIASEKFVRGAAIIPWVMAGMVLEGLLPIIGAALYIQKRSKVILWIVAAAAAANIFANLILVPEFGLLGAAWATFGSYALILMAALFLSGGVIRFSMPWRSLAQFLLSAIVMAWLVAKIDWSNSFARLSAQILLGIVVYGLLMLLLDRQIRQALPGLLVKLKLAK